MAEFLDSIIVLIHSASIQRLFITIVLEIESPYHVLISVYLVLLFFQAKLELVKVDGPVDHAKAFGRIAFACDRNEVCDSFHLLWEISFANIWSF